MINSGVNTRELILEILLEIEEEGEHSHIAIRNALSKYQFLPKQERSFITRVCEGTLEYRIYIDYVIDSFSKVPVNKMKPQIREILRSAVYQLKFMDSVPDSAVCNEAVKLAQRKGFYNLKPFVNGVLRTIAREIGKLELPSREEDEVRYLSVKYSMPEYLVEKWKAAYGVKTTEKILEDFLTERPITVRCRTHKASLKEIVTSLKAQGVTVQQAPYLPYALKISDYNHILTLDAFLQGKILVQDISSMLVAQTAAPKKGDYVIDVCAAPGGKSTHIAELLQGSGHVLARDLTDNKVDMIEENIERHGLNNMSAEVWDATVFDADSAGKADILICDLPCSGLGVLGRKKDIRYKMTPESVDEIAALQRQILDTVHTYVKPNGVLVYSTCTIDEAENEDNVRWFIEKHPEFELDKSFAEGTGMKQILPGEHGSDGFFIARFIKSKL